MLLLNILCLSVTGFFAVLWQVAPHRSADMWIALGLLSVIATAPFIFMLMYMRGYRVAKPLAIGTSALAIVLVMFALVASFGTGSTMETKLGTSLLAITLVLNFYFLISGDTLGRKQEAAAQPDKLPE